MGRCGAGGLLLRRILKAAGAADANCRVTVLPLRPPVATFSRR